MHEEEASDAKQNKYQCSIFLISHITLKHEGVLQQKMPIVKVSQNHPLYPSRP